MVIQKGAALMPRTAVQYQALRGESRARILEAALDVFARLGYEGASVRLIARQAGVAQGLLYNYFESKEQLLRAIFERGMRDVQASFEAAEVGGDPPERLERLIRHSFATVRQNLRF